MSSDLSWVPIPKDDQPLSTAIKGIFREHFGDELDGLVLNHASTSYLQGLRDASSGQLRKDAETLLAAIEEHEEIRLKEVF